MFQVTKKIQSSNSKAFFQLALMMVLTIFIQFIMLMKISVVASSFGVSVEMDAFNFANSIGECLYSFIGSGITTVLIPNLVNKQKKESINIFISFLYSIAFIILIVVYFSKGFLVRSLSSGNEEFILITCNIMFITLLTQYINSFTGTTNAIFQCSEKFNIPKLINLVTSILLVGLLISINNLNIYMYAAMILITNIINVALQIYVIVKQGYKFKYKINFKNYEFKKMLRVFVPTVLSTGLYQIALLTDNIISSNLGEGEISKLSYSNNIISLVNSVILVNIMTYFYPKIAKSIKNNNSQKDLFDFSILINSIMIFIVVVFLLVGKEGIAILYERGEFTSSNTLVVYICTSIYMLSLPINAFRDLIYKYFYANQDTLTPFKNSIIISVLNIVISIILAKFMGIYGVIWGTVLTSYISLSMILIKFVKKFTIKYRKKVLIFENFKSIISAIITFIIVKLLKYSIPQMNEIIEFIIYGLFSILIYIGIIVILKSKAVRVDLSK